MTNSRDVFDWFLTALSGNPTNEATAAFDEAKLLDAVVAAVEAGHLAPEVLEGWEAGPPFEVAPAPGFDELRLRQAITEGIEAGAIAPDVLGSWTALASPQDGQAPSVVIAASPPVPLLTVCLRDARGQASRVLDQIALSIAAPLGDCGIVLLDTKGRAIDGRGAEAAAAAQARPILTLLAGPAPGDSAGLPQGLPSFAPGAPRFARAAAWTVSLAPGAPRGSWLSLADPKAVLARLTGPEGRAAASELVASIQRAVAGQVARAPWLGDLGGLTRSLYSEGLESLVRHLLPRMEAGAARFMLGEDRPVTDALIGACCLVIESTRFGPAKAERTWSVAGATAMVGVVRRLVTVAADAPTADALRELAGDLDSALAVRERIAKGDDQRRLRAARDELAGAVPMATNRDVRVLGGADLIDFTLAATWYDPLRIAREPDSSHVLVCGIDRFVGAYLRFWAARVDQRLA